MRRMVDWSKHLTKDLVLEIVKRFDSYADYTRFRATCKIWRSFLPRFTKKLLPWELPCLILAYSGHSDFFSLFVEERGEVYNLVVPLDENVVCVGSSKGWLITLDDTPSIRLLNPLKTDTPMELPPVYTLPSVVKYIPENIGAEYLLPVPLDFPEGVYQNVSMSTEYIKHSFIHKVVLSCRPTQNNCLAMAIFDERHQLACCKLGDQTWRSVELGWISHVVGGKWWPHVDDIAHYNGKFYIVDMKGTVFVLSDEEIMDSRSPLKPQLFVHAQDVVRGISTGRLYLVVESPNELLVVNRDVPWADDTDSEQACNFDIFKLDLNSRSWSKAESLGVNALFLGVNESFSVSCASLPRSSFKGNCIYHIDDEPEDDPQEIVGVSDVSVFDLENHSNVTLQLPVPGDDCPEPRIWPHSLWIKPSGN